jgi:hypothetical protein
MQTLERPPLALKLLTIFTGTVLPIAWNSAYSWTPHTTQYALLCILGGSFPASAEGGLELGWKEYGSLAWIRTPFDGSTQRAKMVRHVGSRQLTIVPKPFHLSEWDKTRFLPRRGRPDWRIEAPGRLKITVSREEVRRVFSPFLVQ